MSSITETFSLKLLLILRLIRNRSVHTSDLNSLGMVGVQVFTIVAALLTNSRVAMIDLVVTQYLYRKFPEGTPGQLSWARSRAVCSQTMAWVATTQLGLHKVMLANNSELNMALAKHTPILESFSAKDIVAKSWRLDPPKALSDVLESIMGAVLLDTAYDYERSEAVVEWVMRDILDALTLDLPPDPVSQLMISTARNGCRRIHFQYVLVSHALCSVLSAARGHLAQTSMPRRPCISDFLTGKRKAILKSTGTTEYLSSSMTSLSAGQFQAAASPFAKPLLLNRP